MLWSYSVQVTLGARMMSLRDDEIGNRHRRLDCAINVTLAVPAGGLASRPRPHHVGVMFGSALQLYICTQFPCQGLINCDSRKIA